MHRSADCARSGIGVLIVPRSGVSGRAVARSGRRFSPSPFRNLWRPCGRWFNSCGRPHRRWWSSGVAPGLGTRLVGSLGRRLACRAGRGIGVVRRLWRNDGHHSIAPFHGHFWWAMTAVRKRDSSPEIEITEAMIEAGLDALRDEPAIELWADQARDVVIDVIRRTWKAYLARPAGDIMPRKQIPPTDPVASAPSNAIFAYPSYALLRILARLKDDPTLQDRLLRKSAFGPRRASSPEGRETSFRGRPVARTKGQKSHKRKTQVPKGAPLP